MFIVSHRIFVCLIILYIVSFFSLVFLAYGGGVTYVYEGSLNLG